MLAQLRWGGHEWTLGLHAASALAGGVAFTLRLDAIKPPGCGGVVAAEGVTITCGPIKEHAKPAACDEAGGGGGARIGWGDFVGPVAAYVPAGGACWCDEAWREAGVVVDGYANDVVFIVAEIGPVL